MLKKRNRNNLNNEEELLQKAFDVDEKISIPDDYQIDITLDQQSTLFIKNVQKERNKIENKNKKMNKEIQYEFNINVNNQNSFIEIYEKLNIKQEFITEVKNEFYFFKNYFETNEKYSKNNKSKELNLNVNEIVNKYRLQKENIKTIPFPNDSILFFLSCNLTNRICIKLINLFEKLYFLNENKYNVLLWIYYMLLFIDTPLIDEDNSTLYSLNKNILKNLTDSQKTVNSNIDNSNENIIISEKIIYIIISEIFGQKIITLNFNINK